MTVRFDPLADVQHACLWQEQVPAEVDRRGRRLPDVADLVVIGGGYTGLSAAREAARQGAAVTLLEAERLGWGASTRNGGMSLLGYKWGPRELERRYGPDLAAELHRESVAAVEHVASLIDAESIAADFTPNGHLELAYAESHVADLRDYGEQLVAAGSPARYVERADLRDEIGTDAYPGALLVEQSGGLHPARFHAGLAEAAARAGADLHEGVRATVIRTQADGRSVVETTRGAVLARDVLVATNGYTDGVAPSLRRRIIPIGSYIIASEVLDEGLAREISPRGRMFFDTKNFLYYWRLTPDRRLLFGGRASFLPASIDRVARILQRGMVEIHPQLAETRIEYAWGGNVGFTLDRMPHVGRLGGVTYAMGCCGNGVATLTYLGARAAAWIGGAPAPALARLPFPLVPAPYEGRPWFLPLVGEWFRLRDRRAARSRKT